MSLFSGACAPLPNGGRLVFGQNEVLRLFSGIGI